MSVTANYDLKLDIFDTPAAGQDHAADQTFQHRILSSGTLDADSSAPATKAFADQRTLSGGADAIDLAALTGPLSSTVDFTELKVQLVKIKAAAANTAAIVVKPAAANGYHLFGDADGQVTLAAGCEVLMRRNDDLPDVGPTAKDLAITSSDADAVWDIELVAG